MESVTATDNPAIAEAKAAEAKSKAEEAAARAEKAKADAKRALSDAATAAKSSSGASGSSAARSSYSSPSIWISCDPDSYTPNVTFSGDWRFSTSTAKLFIDYGDGRHYTTSHIPLLPLGLPPHLQPVGHLPGDHSAHRRRGNTTTDSCVTGYYYD